MNLKKRISLLWALMFVCPIVIWGSGCGRTPKLVTVDRFVEFNKAGPVVPQVDMEQLVQAKMPEEEYHLVKGDVIDFDLPADLILSDVEVSMIRRADRYYRCRVNQAGEIKLPIIGNVKAAGRTLSEIETELEGAYYPKYLTYPPSIVGSIAWYHKEDVSVLGAVANPGVYKCRRDEMTLVSVLMKAGGISEGGAAVIRIRSRDKKKKGEPVVLPLKGLRIPFADVQLHRGDIVEVEPLKPQVFTVIGLVRNPGAFAYPPDVKYNVLQTLAFAGGLNDVADPQYIRVYRQKSNGELVDAAFKIGGEGITDAANVIIKPGDVVSVEQTPRTRRRLLMAEVVRVTFGVNIGTMYRYLQGKDTTTRY